GIRAGHVTGVQTCALPISLALAKHLGARPSSLGLSVYLRAGYQFGSVTNWEGIERLDPGTRVTFTRDGAVRHTYWRPTVDPAVRSEERRVGKEIRSRWRLG